MYKQYYDSYGDVCSNAIIRTTDNACIPFDDQNVDYVEYLAWLAEGNAPTPAETPEG
jgi:hypothetical protein